MQTSPEGYTAEYKKNGFVNGSAHNLKRTATLSWMRKRGRSHTIGVEYWGFKGHLGRPKWVFGRKNEMSAKESAWDSNEFS